MLGEPCPNGFDRDCKFIKNGVCHKGSCQCRDGYMRKSASECVEALWVQSQLSLSELNQLSCAGDMDCIESIMAPRLSICVNNKCQCRDFAILDWENNICITQQAETGQFSSSSSSSLQKHHYQLKFIGYNRLIIFDYF